LSGQLLATAHDRRQTAVPQPDFVPLPRLAAEPEPDRRSIDANVPAPQGGQAERPVEPCVLVVPDPDQCRLEKPDDRGEDLLTGQARAGEVRVTATPDAREGACDVEQPLELRLVAPRAPAGVIAILLPSTRIAPGRLEVTGGVRADPDVRPGGRDRQRPDPAED